VFGDETRDNGVTRIMNFSVSSNGTRERPGLAGLGRAFMLYRTTSPWEL